MSGSPSWAAMIVAFGLQTAHAADAPAVQARVECEFASGSNFPFSAGRDRCWDPVNGKTMVPKAVVACAVKRSDGTLAVTFRFSESLKPECEYSKVATKEQQTQAVPMLGPKERAFFQSQVGSK